MMFNDSNNNNINYLVDIKNENDLQHFLTNGSYKLFKHLILTSINIRISVYLFIKMKQMIKNLFNIYLMFKVVFIIVIL